jgi:hypothetical protein
VSGPRVCMDVWMLVRGLTIKFANSPPCACRGNSDVGISAFHSCVVVDLWQSLSEWRLL